MTRPADRPRITPVATAAASTPRGRRRASALLAVCGLVAGSVAGVSAVVGAPSAAASPAETSQVLTPALTLTQLTPIGVERSIDGLTGALHFYPGPSVAAGTTWQVSLDGGAWQTASTFVPSTNFLAARLTGLVPGRAHTVRLRPVTAAGPGTPTAAQEVLNGSATISYGPPKTSGPSISIPGPGVHFGTGGDDDSYTRYERSVVPIIGADRFNTAAVVSRKAAEARPLSGVVVVNGQDGAADSLAAGPLAAASGAGLLLVSRDDLPSTAADYIRENGVTTATVVGGTGVVTDRVVEQLKQAGITSVQRISGADRYETSLLVAAQPAFAGAKTTFVAGGTAIPDAVSAGGVAGRLKAPVVLVPSSGALPYADRYQALTGGRTVVVGSTNTVSDDVARALGADVRLGGADRYGTSLEVARWAVKEGVSANEVAVASSVGTRNADALAASVLGGITLLVPTQSWGKDVHSFLLGSGTTSVLTIGGSTPHR